MPIIFGLGGPLVAMVGTNIGAGRRERALRIAWIGAAVAAGLTELVGLTAAAFPHAWLSLFDNDPAMLELRGPTYLRIVGPFYGLFGLGLALYFASQGAGRLLWPFIANVTRLLIAAGGGFVLLRWSGDLTSVYFALGAALAAFGLINAVAVACGSWFASRGETCPQSRRRALQRRIDGANSSNCEFAAKAGRLTEIRAAVDVHGLAGDEPGIV